jgi:hypothetical protein
MAGGAYLTIIDQSTCARAEEDSSPAMHVECIGRPVEVPAASSSEGPAVRPRLRRTRPESRPTERAVARSTVRSARSTVRSARSIGPLMHSSCIGTRGSRRLASGAGARPASGAGARPASGAGARPTRRVPGEVA